jgi:hypothetical protein
LDKKSFGGPGKLHSACVERKCVTVLDKNSGKDTQREEQRDTAAVKEAQQQKERDIEKALQHKRRRDESGHVSAAATATSDKPAGGGSCGEGTGEVARGGTNVSSSRLFQGKVRCT